MSLNLRSIFSVSLILFLLCWPMTTLAGPVYRVDEGSGVIRFTTRNPGKRANYRLISNRSIAYSKTTSFRRKFWHFSPIVSRYDKMINYLAQVFTIEAALIKAVIHVESAFDKDAVSSKGAYGLMQLMPATARRFGVSERQEPLENLRGGVKYLKWLLNHYRGDLELTVAAYNAGEGAVDKYGRVPPFPETRNYVTRVMRALKGYRCQMGINKNCS